MQSDVQHQCRNNNLSSFVIVFTIVSYGTHVNQLDRLLLYNCIHSPLYFSQRALRRNPLRTLELHTLSHSLISVEGSLAIYYYHPNIPFLNLWNKVACRGLVKISANWFSVSTSSICNNPLLTCSRK